MLILCSSSIIVVFFCMLLSLAHDHPLVYVTPIRSPTSPGTNSAMSPTSIASHEQHPADSNANTTDEYSRTMSPVSQDTYYRDANDTTPRPYRDMDDNNSRPYRDDDMTPRPYDDNGQRQYREDDASRPYNNNTLKLDNESLMMSQQVIGAGEDYAPDEHTGSVYNDQEQNATPNRTANSQYKDNYETTFDLDGNVETKSICSAKSGGSGHDNRYSLHIFVKLCLFFLLCAFCTHHSLVFVTDSVCLTCQHGSLTKKKQRIYTIVETAKFLLRIRSIEVS